MQPVVLGYLSENRPNSVMETPIVDEDVGVFAGRPVVNPQSRSKKILSIVEQRLTICLIFLQLVYVRSFPFALQVQPLQEKPLFWDGF